LIEAFRIDELVEMRNVFPELTNSRITELANCRINLQRLASSLYLFRLTFVSRGGFDIWRLPLNLWLWKFLSKIFFRFYNL